MSAPSAATLTVASPKGPSAWSDALLAELASTAGAGAGGEHSALAGRRARATELLALRGLPGRREEAWRFTDLAPLLAVAPRLCRLQSEPLPAPEVATTLRVTLQGEDDPLAGTALPAGIERLGEEEIRAELGSVLAATGCQDDVPVLLNEASGSRLLALRVRGAVAPVLELVSEAGTAEGLLPVRVLLLLEPGAHLHLLQVHRSSGASLTSVVVEVRLAAGAHLRHGMLAEGSEAGVLLAHLAVVQDPGSALELTTATAGWGLVRLEPRLLQSQGAARSRLRGLQVARGSGTADTHSQVAFGGPEGELDQLHKAVADEAGHSVFNGAVRVPRLAQRTRAAQLSRNLLLSDRARIDTKPELEIVADDVTCSHGATVSRLQEEELFYLRSRGIGAAQAAGLLLRGFCEEVVAELPAAAAAWQPLRALLGQEVHR